MQFIIIQYNFLNKNWNHFNINEIIAAIFFLKNGR